MGQTINKRVAKSENIPLDMCDQRRLKSVSASARSGPGIIKLLSCSTQLRMKFHLAIKLKIPTIIFFHDHLSWACSAELIMKEVLKNYQYFKICKQNKFHAQLSFITSGPDHNLQWRLFASQGYKVSSCGKRRLKWVCADAQANLGHRWAHVSEGTFSHVATSNK